MTGASDVAFSVFAADGSMMAPFRPWWGVYILYFSGRDSLAR